MVSAAMAIDDTSDTDAATAAPAIVFIHVDLVFFMGTPPVSLLVFVNAPGGKHFLCHGHLREQIEQHLISIDDKR
tara:strand:+ start:3215 stop:3439 length:225 start_codon:yes stop_codon:yes gene_type:complete